MALPHHYCLHISAPLTSSLHLTTICFLHTLPLHHRVSSRGVGESLIHQHQGTPPHHTAHSTTIHTDTVSERLTAPHTQRSHNNVSSVATALFPPQFMIFALYGSPWVLGVLVCGVGCRQDWCSPGGGAAGRNYREHGEATLPSPQAAI